MNDINGAFFVYFDTFKEASEKSDKYFLKKIKCKNDPISYSLYSLLQDQHQNKADRYLIKSIKVLLLSTKDKKIEKELKETMLVFRKSIKRRTKKWKIQ